MADQNKLLQLAQAGGSPYDEDAYLNFPNVDQSVLNAILNRRMEERLPQTPSMDQMHRMMSERIPHMMTNPGYEQKLRNRTMMRLGGPEPDATISQSNIGYNPRARALGYGESPANQFLNQRLYDRFTGQSGSSPYGGPDTDYNLEMRYGPNGIPEEPYNSLAPYNSYPQRRR